MTNNKEKILAEVLEEVKNKQFFGRVNAPTKQKLRFEIPDLITKILEDEKDNLLTDLENSYLEGKETYEKALNEAVSPGVYEELFKKNRTTYLNFFKDSHEAGIARATDYICYRLCRKFYEEINISINHIENGQEYSTLGMFTKLDRENEARRLNDSVEAKKEKAYWDGWDDKVREERKKWEKENNERYKNKSLIRILIEDIFLRTK